MLKKLLYFIFWKDDQKIYSYLHFIHEKRFRRQLIKERKRHKDTSHLDNEFVQKYYEVILDV